MATQVSKSKFKAKALEYLLRVETSGEPIIVTDHGQPTPEIRRYVPVARNPLQVLRGSVLRYDRPTDPVAEDDWEGGN